MHGGTIVTQKWLFAKIFVSSLLVEHLVALYRTERHDYGRERLDKQPFGRNHLDVEDRGDVTAAEQER